MTFANPKMLWLLLVIPPALVAFFWWSARVRQGLLTQFIQARLLPSLTVGISATRQKIRLGCLVLAVVCLILALARPQWGFDWEEIKQRGLDIVVAIDTSKSMLAEDIAPNRLARAKLAALELMQRAKADRLGLVAFAGSAFLQCPLTIDDTAFRQSVEALDVNTIPQGGTAIAEAIETALTAYKEGDNYKVLVLLTDGEDHDSGAVAAAEKAAKDGLRIYTVGIGTAEGELLRVKDAQGNSDYVRDEQGNVVKSHLDERLLQQIASATEGGFYLPLRGAKAIDTLYDQGLATLPKSQHQAKLVRQYHERFYWPLVAAIVLLLVEMLFPERRRERPPKSAAGAEAKTPGGPSALPGPPPASQPRPPAPSLQLVASLLMLGCLGSLLFCPRPALASPSSALREYKSGNYEQALKEYERLLKKDKDDPRLHFNAGAAAYKNHQFDEAARQFNATLSAPDLKLQGLGYYNEGNALFHLGEGNQDPKQRKEAWEKALQDYQSTMKLSPQDTDAKHNYEFVKKMLEELKQQQQQSKQDKQDQKQNQDQQQQNQQQDQQKQDQQKQQDQQQQQQAKQDQKQESSQQQKSEEQKKQEEQQQQAEQAEQKKQEQQQAQQAEQKKQEQQQAQQASAEKEKSDEKGQEGSAAQAMAQMTPEQAKQLLDAEKEDEKLLQPKSTGKPSDQTRPFKDW
jgi:Ca-activated chloride channel family protein